jgi:hypothetical protein
MIPSPDINRVDPKIDFYFDHWNLWEKDMGHGVGLEIQNIQSMIKGTSDCCIKLQFNTQCNPPRFSDFPAALL